MMYFEAVELLYHRLPMYQKTGSESAIKEGLKNTLTLLEKLENPHHQLKFVHIAGTNGKGTSAHAIAAICQSAGYKVGLYTSPHLKEFKERIRVNGKEIEERYVVNFVQTIEAYLKEIHPSFFEVTVAMALVYFFKKQVDIAIIETGLGGRLDSTNVILPEVALITNIGMDHTNILGDTIEEIALEKSGIIKPNRPTVIGEYHPQTWEVFKKRAQQQSSKLVLAKKRQSLLENPVQTVIKNEAAILAVIEELNTLGWSIADEAVEEGMKNVTALTGIKGRVQILSRYPLMIADIAHNIDGMTWLLQYIATQTSKRLHMIFGTVRDKSLTEILAILPKTATYYWTQPHLPRALSVQDLVSMSRQFQLGGDCFENVNEAIKNARNNASPEDCILITGSTFLVAEIDDL